MLPFLAALKKFDIIQTSDLVKDYYVKRSQNVSGNELLGRSN